VPSDTERLRFIDKAEAKVEKASFFWRGHYYSNWWVVETLDGIYRHYSLEKAIDAAMSSEENDSGS
jgi:hypothetical protein